MISSVALVLFFGKAASAIYNFAESKRSPSADPKNTFEKRNVCAKTTRAAIAEAAVYLAIWAIAMTMGR